MTGKYMRPLIAMGLGADSDTWAGLLRRYGYRTAAFYPPAVFFIDGDHFEAMRARGLDFEYRKEEFATPELRTRQVSEYLATAPHDKPMFLWVHFFEPHEPYVAHPEHPFGTSDIDRYDSEIATADDAIGAIVREVQSARPGAIVIATADHGEEFGEHGGRYHGTTVFEEQVRVPLLSASPARRVFAAATLDRSSRDFREGAPSQASRLPKRMNTLSWLAAIRDSSASAGWAPAPCTIERATLVRPTTPRVIHLSSCAT
jgi:hypothetical protein